MKKYVSILISFCLLFGLAACSPSVVTEEPGIDEEYIPKFMDIDEGKETLKPLIFGSMGWTLKYAQPYLFAIAAGYIVRYNTDVNTVDKIIDLGKTPGGPHVFSTSAQGRYLTSHISDFHGGPFQNYFLLDCEDETAELLAEIYDEIKVDKIRDEKIPEEVKKEFRDDMFFSSGYPDTGIRIDGKSYLEDGNDFIYAFMQSKNITCIDTTSFIGEYMIADENTIFGIIPTNPEESGELGYYKFIKIDVEQDEIVQEYILNEK